MQGLHSHLVWGEATPGQFTQVKGLCWGYTEAQLLRPRSGSSPGTGGVFTL